MNCNDRLQQAWQSQPAGKLDRTPDQLLKVARLERRVAFWADIFVISVLLAVGAWMLMHALRDIHRDWPWLIYSASDIWVVGFMLFNQWRRRRHAARYGDPLLAHVEWSIKDLEHRMVQDRYSFWWYVLPIALGCMIPPILSFAMDYSRNHAWEHVFALLSTLGLFTAIFTFVHLTMKYGRRLGDKTRRQELESLRGLRETLLNTEE
ncbi:MAG TPA: hypothetical protein VG826_00490 [Pirellulales bacterium]|nr:hypothetical protein [Pirellulales bacterium]